MFSTSLRSMGCLSFQTFTYGLPSSRMLLSYTPLIFCSLVKSRIKGHCHPPGGLNTLQAHCFPDTPGHWIPSCYGCWTTCSVSHMVHLTFNCITRSCSETVTFSSIFQNTCTFPSHVSAPPTLERTAFLSGPLTN